MANFQDALVAGIAAHDQAQADQEEIAMVIRELDETAKRLSNGKISAVLESDFMGAALGALTAGKTIARSKRTQYLTLRPTESKAVNAGIAVAQWDTVGGGYPVTMKFEEVEYHCFDRESLEKKVGELLTTAAVGRAFRQLWS